MFNSLKIQITSAEILVPIQEEDRSELTLVGSLANRLKVVDDHGNDLSGVACEVTIISGDSEAHDDKIGTIWVEKDRLKLTATIDVVGQAFDRLLQRLIEPSTNRVLQLEVSGLRHSDVDGGTLEWDNLSAIGAQIVVSATLSAELF